MSEQTRWQMFAASLNPRPGPVIAISSRSCSLISSSEFAKPARRLGLFLPDGVKTIRTFFYGWRSYSLLLTLPGSSVPTSGLRRMTNEYSLGRMQYWE